MARSPPGPEPRRAPNVATVDGHKRGDRHEVVGIGGVTQAQGQSDQQGDDQRSAGEERLEPGVELLDRLEEEVEAHELTPPCRAAQRGQRPTIGKCAKPTTKPNRS